MASISTVPWGDELGKIPLSFFGLPETGNPDRKLKQAQAIDFPKQDPIPLVIEGIL